MWMCWADTAVWMRLWKASSGSDSVLVVRAAQLRQVRSETMLKLRRKSGSRSRVVVETPGAGRNGANVAADAILDVKMHVGRRYRKGHEVALLRDPDVRLAHRGPPFGVCR